MYIKLLRSSGTYVCFGHFSLLFFFSTSRCGQKSMRMRMKDILFGDRDFSCLRDVDRHLYSVHSTISDRMRLSALMWLFGVHEKRIAFRAVNCDLRTGRGRGPYTP